MEKQTKKSVVPDDTTSENTIFVASFVHWKTGKRIFASQFGKKAFAFSGGKSKRAATDGGAS